jgi:hypothetical protein
VDEEEKRAKTSGTPAFLEAGAAARSTVSGESAAAGDAGSSRADEHATYRFQTLDV